MGSGYAMPYPSRKQIDAVNRYQTQLQLISGWNNLTNKMIEHEITGASSRIGFNLKRYYFVLPPATSSRSARLQFMRWKRLLIQRLDDGVGKYTVDQQEVPQEMRIQADGSYVIFIDDACAALVMNAKSPRIVSVLRFMIFALSSANASIPILMAPENTSTITKIFFATSFPLNLILALFILSFLQTAFMDFYRRWLFSYQLAALVRVDESDAGILLHTDKKQYSALYKNSFRKSTSMSSKTQPSSSMSMDDREVIFDVKEVGSASDRVLEAWNPCYHEQKNEDQKLDSCIYSEFPPIFDAESSHSFEDEELEMLPRLDMTIPQNYISWLAARTVLRNFGARFLFRLNIYNGKIFSHIHRSNVLSL
jgi:hypothetical protein